ncbi:acyltransferase [Massilia sp. P8910]|uniref:Acyltransferase n=1 Tax=Massilia antarctica TaxID=2765360 RepID=A0AA49A6D4_9BURK|nr:MULTISPECIES: acyltransferase [Massilia]CUI08376.1 acyltransferase family protein [Janthinobacterium sp. CG23_2]MCE3604771.1 acyltransferase [Massilia antarctica]MCY0916059.1 acyltransferase [Massilia sp. H27-R4]QPI47435.1 acyltransferase [Massilia antarctica]CUU32162.1 acyltransferase family protein [Janthinobacterium sp. CG23_2]
MTKLTLMDSHSMPPSRNLELDRLRAVAVILTFFVHFRQVFFPWTFTMTFKESTSVLDLFSMSWGGVDLFFVISGFIISKTIVGEFDKLRNQPFSLASTIKAFYVRRIFRILPVAWCVIALVLVCGEFFNEGHYFANSVYNVQAAINVFTYTFNYWLPEHKTAQGVPLAPFWSLSVEEQFYLFFPIFLLLARTTRQRVLLLVGALAVVSFVIRPFTLSNPVHVFFYTQSRCDGLLYGCLLYLFTAQPWFSAIRVHAGRHRYAGAVLVSVLAVAIAGATGLGFSNTVVVPVVCALSIVLVFIAACEGGLVVFPWPLQIVLDYIGKRSYTIYLVHLPMFFLTMEIMFRYTRQRGMPINSDLWLAYTVLMFALVLGMTELIYRLVERPMIARGRLMAEKIMAREHDKVVHASVSV